jgi:thiol:disulfide interchange protein DsbD
VATSVAAALRVFAVPASAIQLPLGDALQSNPWLALAILFGAGVLTSLTPCVYPMIPITAAALSGVDTERRTTRRVVALTASYVLGLALLYASLGLLAGLTGSLFGTVSASPWASLAAGNLLLLFGLAMLDVFPIRIPARFEAWAAGLGGGSIPAVFLLGATSGVVAAPCGAPAFAAVLTYVGTTGSAWLGFVYLFVFSLGMTALLVAVGLSAGALSRLPRSGVWMVRVKQLAGVALLLVAEYYFVRAGYSL